MLKRITNYRLIPTIFLLASLSLQVVFAEGTSDLTTDASHEINAIITAKQHPFLRQVNFTFRSQDLDDLYKLANYQLLWLGNSNSAKNIADVLDLLANASAHGLLPENYDVSALRAKYNRALALTPTEFREQALYDTALSIALLRFLHDMHYGRVNPHGINYKLQLREKKILALPNFIKDSLFLNTISQLPLLVEPKLHQYQKLKSALAAYRQIAEQSPTPEFAFPGKLKLGDHHPQLTALSQYLAQLGDLPANAVINNAEKNPAFTPEMLTAVKSFQQRHGLSADGTIGQSTVDALNVPLVTRISQIELAMERLRWLPEFSTGRSIIVNIPAFQLWAIDDISNSEANNLNMRVVVGKALKNETPVLMAQMSYIEFAPYWNVPKKILKEEIIPKLLSKSSYLAAQNMEIIPNNSNSAAPIAVNSDSIDKLKKGVYRIRQKPGTKNSLGKVKFIFPNKDDVYLHDTPANSLFSKSRRDFSHGCVRVADPALLAEFALKNQGNWNLDTIQKAMKNPVNHRVNLAQPIPVLFFYTTAFVDQANHLAFYPDIYGHDNVLTEALKTTNDLPDQSIFVSSAVPLPETDTQLNP